MKNKALYYLLVGGIAYYFIYKSKSQKKDYKIIVPEPQKLTQDQYNKFEKAKTIFQKAAPVVKKIFKKKKSVGNFPYTF